MNRELSRRIGTVLVAGAVAGGAYATVDFVASGVQTHKATSNAEKFLYPTHANDTISLQDETEYWRMTEDAYRNFGNHAKKDSIIAAAGLAVSLVGFRMRERRRSMSRQNVRRRR